MFHTAFTPNRRITFIGLVGAVALALVPSAASAATSIDGPVDLGTATDFAVLGASTVTNTGPSIIGGDLGLSPGTDVTGFPPGVLNGTLHATDALAAQAQQDLTTAYGVAASLTPSQSGLTDLVDLTLVPGVYSGGALSLSGALTLDGTAESVWVFQAASTLITSSASEIVLLNGASACNVFWQVSDSATLGSASDFSGTIMANVSITATTAATISGRLLARTGAVTLDSNTITAPDGCADASGTVVSSSPTITSDTPTGGTVGTPYSFAVTATGSPAPSYGVTSGALPAGLALDSASGVISGTPIAAGTSTFSITASNGLTPDSVADYEITVTSAGGSGTGGGQGTGGGRSLAATGDDPVATIVFGSIALVVGTGMVLIRRRSPRVG